MNALRKAMEMILTPEKTSDSTHQNVLDEVKNRLDRTAAILLALQEEEAITGGRRAVTRNNKST